MSREEVQQAVIAFLDQFISRGAASDILDLRDRLRTDPPTRERLQQQIAADNLSEREAFDAMRAFLVVEYERQTSSTGNGQPDLVDLISWTRWEAANKDGHFAEDGTLQMTGDPAQWHDWLRVADSVTTAK
jgi:hypothetical protein